MRFLRWQIGSRLLSAPVAVPFVEKSVLVVERSMTGATGNVYCGLHEFDDMAFALHFLRSDDLFVDVGANVGSYTVLASGVVGAKSICIEPVRVTFDKLQRNIRYNDIGSLVGSLRCVVGREPGTMTFSVDCDTVNRVVDKSYLGKQEVIEMKTLDDILVGESPIMWKVDVEGFEQEVLAGAESSLHSPALLAVQLEADTESIGEKMRSAGFTLCSYDGRTRRLQSQGAAKFPLKMPGNHLWIRDIETVARRCQTARPFHLHGVDF